jgi:hypothetical protein
VLGCGTELNDLKTMSDRFSFHGKYGPDDVEKINLYNDAIGKSLKALQP